MPRLGNLVYNRGMNKLIDEITDKLNKDISVMLCVITSKDGSVPGALYSGMLVMPDGSSIGTIGGGICEYEATMLARTLIVSERSLVQTYNLNADAGVNGVCDAGTNAVSNSVADAVADAGAVIPASNNFDSVCGGNVTVTFCFIKANADTKELFRTYYSKIGRDVQKQTAQSQAVQSQATRPDQADSWLLLGNSIDSVGRLSFRVGEDTFGALDLIHDEYVSIPTSRSGCVYIFGGGHVASALVPVLNACDFTTVIVDDRSEYASSERFPTCAKTYCIKPCDISNRLVITSKDYVCIMTHNHENDLDVLLNVLKTDATYIGLMGSRKKTEFIRNAVYEHGFTKTDWTRVKIPIGLEIGSQTPGEIAVSIAAELIQKRHNQCCC